MPRSGRRLRRSARAAAAGPRCRGFGQPPTVRSHGRAAVRARRSRSQRPQGTPGPVRSHWVGERPGRGGRFGGVDVRGRGRRRRHLDRRRHGGGVTAGVGSGRRPGLRRLLRAAVAARLPVAAGPRARAATWVVDRRARPPAASPRECASSRTRCRDRRPRGPRIAPSSMAARPTLTCGGERNQ